MEVFEVLHLFGNKNFIQDTRIYPFFKNKKYLLEVWKIVRKFAKWTTNFLLFFYMFKYIVQ